MLVQKLPNTKRQINNSFEFFELNATKASCRVKRHLPTTRSRQLGRPAETKPAATIYAQGIKVATKFQSNAAPDILLAPKIYSKVLTTTPTVV